MSFAHPQWLNALFALPLFVVFFLVGAKRRRAALAEFTGEKLAPALAPGRSWRRGLAKTALRTAGFALVVVALAGPQFGSHLVKIEREGIDLVIALDTSLSMLAEDMKPSRLERAKQEIVDLIEGLKGDRVGVVVFAGDAYPLCPLTVDYDAALMLVQTADVAMVSEPGTALDRAIEKSVALFPQEGRADRVIILVTDGEGHEGDPVAAAEKASKQGIRIYTIGIGNPKGELIPLRGTGGAIDGYKKDESGETVLSRLDETTLRKIASTAGGEYLPATREGLELKVLYREISGLQRAAIKGEFLEKKKERFAWFLAAAFLALAADLATLGGSMKRRGGKKILHTGAAAAVACLVIASLGTTPALAKGIDKGRVKSGNQYYKAGEYQKALVLYGEARGDTTKTSQNVDGVLYNEANTLHMLGRYPEALEKYHESISEDTVQAGRILYNRANTLSKMGKYPEAVESYLQSLSYAPDDPDARYNLELALRALEEQKKQQQNQQQNQNQKQDQNKDQQKNQGQQDQQKKEQGKQDQQQDQQQQNQGEKKQPQPPDSTQAKPQPSRADSSMARPELPDSVQMTQLSKEDALRLLKLLEEQEKELQKEKRKAAFVRVPRSGKDW
jgi:Ca-activated chloride channel family protein